MKITTNSTEILLAAEESWGRFREIHRQPALQMRIGVLEGGPSECPGDPVVREQRSLRARVADAENFSFSDIRHGFAYAWLTRATVEQRGYLRWHFIEGMAWDLLAEYLTPVHAGCVRYEGRGVLICGDSGAGKSSFTYACAKRGWTFMSDDSSNLVRGREGAVVVGNPYKIRFRESAIALFPELGAQIRTAAFHRRPGHRTLHHQRARNQNDAREFRGLHHFPKPCSCRACSRGAIFQRVSDALV